VVDLEISFECIPDGRPSNGKTAWAVGFRFSSRDIKFAVGSRTQVVATSDGGNTNAELCDVSRRLLMETLIENKTVLVLSTLNYQKPVKVIT
jgi:hypothetical protein